VMKVGLLGDARLSHLEDVDEDALFSELQPNLPALDHSSFVLVVTNAIFTVMTAVSVI